MDIRVLDKIVNDTVTIIETSKDRIFDIAEGARSEYLRLERQLHELRAQVARCIAQVEVKEQETQHHRLRLMEVSRDFKHYSETDIKQAYESAQASQLELLVLQEQENTLRMQRDSIERALRNREDAVRKADDLVTQVGMATQVLKGNLKELTGQLDTMHQRHMLSLRIIRAQEEERRRLARDMHDGPAQMLANVMLRAEICERLLQSNPTQVRVELQSLKDVVRESLCDIRKVIFDLRPMSLDDLGLVPALRRYINDIKEQRGLLIDFSVQGLDRRLPSPIEVGGFRIVQEALNNAQKHARAEHIAVRLEFAADALHISVTDDGRGFDVERALQSGGNHFGLLSMRERVELLAGTWQLESAVGRGTSIRVRLPLREERDENGA